MGKPEIADILIESGSYINTRHTGEDPIRLPDGSTVPVYLSCRRLFAQPEYRKKIASEMVEAVETNYPSANIVVGIATAGIGWAYAIASELNLPMAYVRSGAKGYGVGGLIEGGPDNGGHAVVVDDVLFSGKSVFAASEALRAEKHITTAGYMAIAALNAGGASEYELQGHSVTVLTDHEDLVSSGERYGHLNTEEARLMREYYRKSIL